MPWKIYKLRGTDLYRVKSLRTGKIINKGSTLEKAKAQVRYLGMIEGMKGGSIDDNSNVQSVLFNKDKNTMRQCDKWLKEHNFKINKKTYNFNSKNYYRYRQFDPKHGNIYRMKLIDPDKLIFFVLEYSKN